MALTLLATNNAESTLASAISATDTSLIVSAGTGAEFPDAVAGESYFKLTLTDAATGSQVEIVNVTAKAGDIFTIERAQEGTLARAWLANDMVANMMTADTLNIISQYAQQAADSAEQAGVYAENAAEFGDNKYTFTNEAAGIAATTSGQFFRVIIPDAVGNTTAWNILLNDSGVAVFQSSYPNTEYVNQINARVNVISPEHNSDVMYGGFQDSKGRVPLSFDSKGNTILKGTVNVNSICAEYPDTRSKAVTAYGYGQQISENSERVAEIAPTGQDATMYGGMRDALGRVPLHFNSKGNVILKQGIDITSIGAEYPDTRSKSVIAYGYGESVTDRKWAGGIADALGRLPFSFDYKANPYFKGVPVSKYLGIDSINKSLNGNSLSVSAFGDSLIFGAGTGSPPNGWVEQIAALMPALAFHKYAVGGQVASEIATRQGGFVNLLTLENNTIPASGSVNVTAQKYRPITVNSAGAGQANLFGTIAGVHGVLNATFDSSGNMLTNTFTRTTAGSAVYVDPNSAFILDSNGSEFDIVVLWMGRNDVYAVDFSSRVMTALPACVQHMKYLNKRFIVISITNRTGSTEIKGTTAYNNIITVNQSIQNMYPENYIDIRALMVRSYNPSIPQDVIDFNNDCPPSSLMFDDTHFNAAGYAIIAQAIKKFIQDKGWNS